MSVSQFKAHKSTHSTINMYDYSVRNMGIKTISLIKYSMLTPPTLWSSVASKKTDGGEGALTSSDFFYPFVRSPLPPSLLYAFLPISLRTEHRWRQYLFSPTTAARYTVYLSFGPTSPYYSAEEIWRKKRRYIAGFSCWRCLVVREWKRGRGS